MPAPDLSQHDALSLAHLIRTREISAAEALDWTLGRIERENPALNAVVYRMDDLARAALREGLPDGPFTGVPYLLKDLGALYTGVPTTYGAALFKDAVADHDSELTLRLKRAGLVIAGKSNTPELGLAPSTEPRLFGPTRNPWNREHSPGGSSGGSAAAVAAGWLPMAHATDGGGSIRIPASACGLFGLKPTRMRNPMGPDVAEGWGGLSIGHAVTWSVRDSAALLDATSGPDLGDPYWAPPPTRPFLSEVGQDPGRLRIALTVKPWNGSPVHPECAAAAHDAAKLCARLGHDVEETRPEFDQHAWSEAVRVVVAANVANNLHLRAAALGRELREDDVERVTWGRVRDAATMTAVQYPRALNAIHRVGRAVAAFMQRYDVILSPTMCQPPPRLGALDMSSTDDDAYAAARDASIGFTSLFNSAGNPAASLPLAMSGDGLPIGIQIATRFGDEATLFRLASQLEQAAPWSPRRPPAVAA
ncbi:MAG TPA: amidase [Chloroflexota bacterium]|nr:amidase [Chloroflexota bacterium]